MTKASGWDPRQAGRSAYSAVLVLRGRGWYEDAAGRRWELAPGYLFQRFTRVPHSLWIEADPPWAECWVHLGGAVEDMLAELGLIDRDQPVCQPGLDLALVRELHRAVDALAAASDRELPAQMLRLQGMLLTLLGAARHDGPAFDAERACRLLGDDPRADLRRVAGELGLTYARFRRAFRGAIGIGPGEYRLRRRLDRARAELLEGNRSIADIAGGLGYANPFTFTTLFRRHLGTSPSAWRRGQRSTGRQVRSVGQKPAASVLAQTPVEPSFPP